MSYRGGGDRGGGGYGDRDRSSLAREGQVYVGNLPPDVRTRDIEDLFDKFGRIGFVNLKSAPNGVPFAFVEFEDPRDAEEAIRDRDGYNYDGYVLRVELPRAMGGGRPRGRGGRGGFNNFGGGGGGGRGRPPPSGLRRSDNRVAISDLPRSASWQDLKDHMREAGDICFADVLPDGSGVIEYVNAEDMKYAVKKLDDTKFRSHEGEVSYIRVKEDHSSSGRSSRRRYSRSRSRSRS